METIRWGIIGCGNVTEIKSGPGFQQTEHSELVAVMSRTASKAEDYANGHGVSKWCNDAQQLILDPDVDAVYIATPPDSHKTYTIQTAEAGKPVYVEKPMARTFDECKEMIDACDKNQVPLFVAYYRRSLPKFIKVKEILDSQILGNIRSVNIVLQKPPSVDDLKQSNLPWRVNPQIAGGGYFVDLASHTFDILDYYLGPIDSAYGIANNQMRLYPAEDIVSANFIFKNGIVGNGLWCFSTKSEKDSVEITGEYGHVKFPVFSSEPVRLKMIREDESYLIENPKYIQQPHIESIVKELNGLGKCPSHGKSAARTSWVIDRILESWRKTAGMPA
jgi:predicted dehydrogenase